MPRKQTRGKLRPRVTRRRRVGARKVPRGIGSVMAQRASLIETIDLSGELTTNYLMTNLTFCLGQFPRASQVAPFYKWYKAEFVEYEYTPYFNTFDGTAASGQLPYIYTIMNRTQDLQSPPSGAGQEQWLLSQGAKPRTFSKKVIIRYKPNWCAPSMLMTRTETSLNAVAIAGLEPKYTWLACPDNGLVAGAVQTTMPLLSAKIDPTIFPAGFTPIQNFPLATVYNGHTHYISQGVLNTPSMKCGNLVMRVKWCFKHPNAYGVVPPPPTEIAPEVPA